MELPKPNASTPAKMENPGSLIIFGKPKCGKTTIAAELTRKHGWLMLELEPRGADFVEATFVQATCLEDIKAIGEQIKKDGKPYAGIIVDTVTKLEAMCKPLAANLYRASPLGGTWTGTDVTTLARGAGYKYLRDAFEIMLDYIMTLAPQVIFIGHLASKLIEKNGEELSAVELDLTGKISPMTCAAVDAVAYCYREENETILNFNASDEVVCGSRAAHLKGNKIVVASSDENGNLDYFWDKIYLDIKK